MTRISVKEAAEQVRSRIAAPIDANDGEVVEILLGAYEQMIDQNVRRDAMVEHSVQLAWQTIASCPHKTPDEGLCGHPTNMTPECHEAACPLT